MLNVLKRLGQSLVACFLAASPSGLILDDADQIFVVAQLQ